MKLAFLSLCVVAATANLSPAWAAEELSLSGRRGEDGRFKLEFSYRAGEFLAERAMILVTAQPSDRVLLAHLQPGRLQQWMASPLVKTADLVSEGAMDRISILATLVEGPSPKEDTSIVVIAVEPNGEKVILADARVDTEWFDFSSRHLAEGSARIGDSLLNNCSSGQWYHCCRGQDCSQVCTCCNGPSFFCNAIGQECTIECIDF